VVLVKITFMPILQQATMSQMVEHLIHLNGKPFSLANYPMYKEVYDGRYKRTLFKTGRQVAKSTTLANFSIVECALIPFFSTMFVTPSKEQTTRFSTTRINKTMNYSPIIKKRFLHPDLSDRVFHKQFTNGSEMLFTYGFDDADRLRGPSTDRNCYDKDAYVLTYKGWKLVSELSRDDLVADVNDKGVVEWNRPTRIIANKYTGKMITFKLRGFHLRVTENHKLWINYHIRSNLKRADEYIFEQAIVAAQTAKMGFKMTSAAKWENQWRKYRYFAGLKVKRRGCGEFLKLPYLPFARLVGWYLAEGHIGWSVHKKWKTKSGPRATLTQNKDGGLGDICETLNACKLPYSVTGNRPRVRRICVKSETLGHYFRVLGKSRDKYIPREFFKNSKLLEQVLHGLYAGDAHWRKQDVWQNGTLRTRSRRMAEDVQEAWLRLGRPAVIHTRTLMDEPLYEVCSYNRNYIVFLRAEFKKKNRVKIEDVVDEDIFCFTVKNHRPIVKGSFKSIPVISSNSFDECQDMLYDPVIVVGNETMANSNYHYETYAGTPKTMENTIQYLWEISTQTEWVMPCEGCGKHIFIDNENALGLNGPICVKCGKLLNPLKGVWVDLNPGKSLKGFHISQLIMPQNVPLSWKGRDTKDYDMALARWGRILQKHEESPISTFRNEVLGVSDSIGTRLISKEELESLCTGAPLQNFPQASHLVGCDYYVAGIDWSGGGTTGVSRTVVWIWGHLVSDGRLITKAYKVYPGLNPVEAHEEIVKICKAYNVKFVVGDAGEGALANDLMRKGLGHHRVTQVQYGSNKHALEFNNVDRYVGDRTTLIDNFFMFLKDKKVVFGPLAEMKVAIDDMLNEYEEVTTLGKKVWRHFPQKPDDCLHAALFGWLAYKIVSRDLRFWQE